jgi:CheY-like chemotaxis protein
MDADEIKEEIAHQRALKKEYSKRIRALELQAAKFGLYTPSYIPVEIDDLLKEIAKINNFIEFHDRTSKVNISGEYLFAGDKTKHKILVVDDEKPTRDILAAALKRYGYQTMTAPDGVEALGLASKERPDVMLLDIAMPVMRGTEVLHFIKQRLIPTRVIMLTYTGDLDMVVYCMKNGASDYITKPCDIQLLLDKIKRSIEIDDVIK